MAELSLHIDAAAVAASTASLGPRPNLCRCTSCSLFRHHPQAVIDITDSDERHLQRVFVENLSPSVSVTTVGSPLAIESLRSDLFHELARRLFGFRDGDTSPICPEIKKRIQGFVEKMLDERMGNGGDSWCGNGGSDAIGLSSVEMMGCSGSKRRKTEIVDMVDWLREVAVNPTDEMLEDRVLEEQVLRARKRLFVRLDSATKKSLFSSSKNTGKRSSEELVKDDTENFGFTESANQPRRRSERLVQNANQNLSHLLSRRKRVGIGPTFQADVPEWTCRSRDQNASDAKEDLNDLRWLGYRVWPVAGYDMKHNQAVIGKGKSNSCACFYPGSVSCIYSHVRTATIQLKADLGQAFFDWGFDRMGEEVAFSWSIEEQMKFGALERLETRRECKDFWAVAYKYFSFKSRGQLISYYFNVFLLRKMRNLSRLAPEYIDTDEEDKIIEHINGKRNERIRNGIKGKSRKK